MKKILSVLAFLLIFMITPKVQADSVQVDLYGHAEVIIDPNGTITVNCKLPLDRLCCTVTYNDESTGIRIYGAGDDIITDYTTEPNTEVSIDHVNNRVTFIPED